MDMVLERLGELERKVREALGELAQTALREDTGPLACLVSIDELIAQP